MRCAGPVEKSEVRLLRVELPVYPDWRRNRRLDAPEDAPVSEDALTN